jgi:hypothetical protein
VLIVAALAIGSVACGGGGASSTSTTATSTTVVASSTTTPTSEPTTESTDSIPPVTPPPGQPAECELLSPEALVAVGLPADAVAMRADALNRLAPATACVWSEPGSEPSPLITLTLFYGADPFEILGAARSQSPGGVDVTGLGSDGYYSADVLFVDAGSTAFAIGAELTQDQLVTLAQSVIGNL